MPASRFDFPVYTRKTNGGGGIRQGQHVVYREDESALCNLWFSMLKHVGCPVDHFSDGTTILSEIFS